MFGYVRLYKPELKIKDYDMFRAAYCGVCNALQRRYGLLARMILHYDFAFLALVLQNEPTACENRRCPVHPLGKCRAYRQNEACDYAADAGILLACAKWEDNLQDDGLMRSLPSRLMLTLFFRKYKKAKRRLPELHKTIKNQTDKLRELERANSASMDARADTFARVLSALAPGGDRAREKLLYHVGRFLYITDAADDYERDAARGSGNPIKARYGLGGGALPEDIKQELRVTLDLSCEQASLALRLLPDLPGYAAVENIIGLGLPDTLEKILLRRKSGGTVCKKRNNGE